METKNWDKHQERALRELNDISDLGEDVSQDIKDIFNETSSETISIPKGLMCNIFATNDRVSKLSIELATVLTKVGKEKLKETFGDEVLDMFEKLNNIAGLGISTSGMLVGSIGLFNYDKVSKKGHQTLKSIDEDLMTLLGLTDGLNGAINLAQTLENLKRAKENGEDISQKIKDALG